MGIILNIKRGLIDKMSFMYRVEDVPCSDKGNMLVEIAAGLTLEKEQFGKILEDMLKKNPLFYIQGDLKKRGEKDTPSNFRSKVSQEENNLVVDNFEELFKKISPLSDIVTITSYPRDDRYYSAKIDEEGNMIVSDTRTKGVDEEFTGLIREFLKKYQLDMKKYRECCSGARYNTYLADVLSFILMILSFSNPEMFEERRMDVDIALNDLEDVPQKNRGPWTAKPDHKYLYFKDSEEGINFRVPKSESINEVYEMIKNILGEGDNKEKKLVRDTMTRHLSYNRFSDYWKNDVDDGFAILVIYHCFNDVDLNGDEVKIKKSLSEIIQIVFG